MDVLTVESLGWIYREASVLCNEKIHFMVQWESEIMRLGSLINCSGKAAQTSHKLNVKGRGSKDTGQ